MTAETPATPADSTPSNTKRILGSIGIVIIIGVVVFVVYTITTRDRMASQALKITQTFVRSSPVVESDLGHVISLKKIGEQSVGDGWIGTRNWMVDFDVTGKKASGTVQILVKKQNGQWGFARADLRQGQSKPTSLL